MVALLKSQELAALVDRASVQSEDIINAAFVRGALLILLWMVAYLVVRVASGYWVGRMGERQARTLGSIELDRHAEHGRTQSQ